MDEMGNLFGAMFLQVFDKSTTNDRSFGKFGCLFKGFFIFDPEAYDLWIFKFQGSDALKIIGLHTAEARGFTCSTRAAHHIDKTITCRIDLSDALI